MGIFDGFGYEPAQPDNNIARSMEITEDLVIGGEQYQNPLSSGSLAALSSGLVLPTYPDFETGSLALEQDRKARSAANTNVYRVAETFDMRQANVAVAAVSGQARVSAMVVPFRQKIANIEVQLGDYGVGGTYSFIGWALYGPLTVDPSTGTTNLTALPQVAGATAFVPTTGIRDALLGSGGTVNGGLFQQQCNANAYIEPGVYYCARLLVWTVVPGTIPTFISQIPASGLGAAYDRNNASYTWHAGFLAGQSALNLTLDLTAYTQTPGKEWMALSTNASLV